MPLEATPPDSVDRLLAGWRAKRPDLDFEPVGVVTRLARVRAHIDHRLEPVYAEHGLTAPSFAVLVTLARIDDGTGVTQRRLMDELGLTSGTVSVRMQRLVDEGLVDRRADPESARNSLISLTSRGRELFERVAPAHLANERRLLGGLGVDELDLLQALLRKLLVEFEGSVCAQQLRLGVRLAPGHVTAELRESVGLPAVVGLLVRSVAPGAPGDEAGLQVGDILLTAGQRNLRSVGDLHAAMRDARDGQLTVRVMRGTAEHTIAIPAAPAGTASAAADAPSASGEHQV